MGNEKIYAHVNYEDDYVQPLLLQALKARLPADILVLIQNATELPAQTDRYLEWRQYESIDFEELMDRTDSRLANSYVIRKALIRKHYLSTTVSHWLSKNPDSLLKEHFKLGIDFELDYAEFLDDALVEAFELRDSFARNEDKPLAEREWWILKPGMSDRGQGIRLFSSEEELTEIFEAWDPPSDDEDEDEDENADATSQPGEDLSSPVRVARDSKDDGMITSQLRHFVAQPYIHPPLLMPEPHPSANRKFHIRTYVLAVGALKVYVYRPMLALFAGGTYQAPSEDANELLQSHLTNTCLQSGEREGSVLSFWSLPRSIPGLDANGSVSGGAGDGAEKDWREQVFAQIQGITGQIFEAAARSMAIHFQPLPNAFEIFGLDFMVDADGRAWLLEINAFPDFAQTGGELQTLVGDLFEDVVDVAIKPFFAVHDDQPRQSERLCEVLNIDLGRR